MTGWTPGDRVPTYDELPPAPDGNGRTSWGLFGPADEIGALNRLTAEIVLEALGVVRSGRMVNLSLALDQPSPPPSDRGPYRHSVFEIGRNTLDDRLDDFHPQASSQWDGFRHIRTSEFGWYGGIGAGGLQDLGDRLGIDAVARHGLVTRGVLIDAAGYFEEAGTPLRPDSRKSITVQELQEMLDRQELALRPGDVLLLRTGWIEGFLSSPEGERHRLLTRGSPWPGLHAGEDMARFLWDSGVIAVAADNRSVEASPGEPGQGFLHRRLLTLLGILLGEMWDLAELARECRRSGRYEFLLASVPLNLPRGVGSPANALAIL